MDHNPVFTAQLDEFLKKYGMDSWCFHTQEKFFEALEARTPSLCFIELNLSREGEGLEIVNKMRNKFTHEIPIVMVSEVDDSAFFLKALDAGADDYIVKPYGKHVLISKLLRFIETPELAADASPLFPLNWVGVPVNLNVDFKVLSVDEMGIHLQCDHFVLKDLVLKFVGNLIQEILGTDKGCLLKISHAEFDGKAKKYSYYATFDSTNNTVMTLVRLWLKDKQKKMDAGDREAA